MKGLIIVVIISQARKRAYIFGQHNKPHRLDEAVLTAAAVSVASLKKFAGYERNEPSYLLTRAERQDSEDNLEANKQAKKDTPHKA